ncbi:hypothetical protein H6769_06940 [Candidatus Peribacteria bacterium]|nr:hypothetical protein [Candidatus Peribacteria bacterium]
MLRKIITFFVLASFAISSNMSLVHAFEMREMIDDETGIHAISSTEHSIFCETKSNNSTNKAPECLQVASQDTLVPAKIQLANNKIKTPTVKFIFFNPAIKDQQILNLLANSPSIAPPDFQDKQSYAFLTGIIKNLN